jgi:hypothetical protein
MRPRGRPQWRRIKACSAAGWRRRTGASSARRRWQNPCSRPWRGRAGRRSGGLNRGRPGAGGAPVGRPPRRALPGRRERSSQPTATRRDRREPRAAPLRQRSADRLGRLLLSSPRRRVTVPRMRVPARPVLADVGITVHAGCPGDRLSSGPCRTMSRFWWSRFALTPEPS